ncbi:MAG: DUF805 domain-containing protein [Candidatus Gracilibacteria bacterium]|nr:DUF805 domain-containing protein [Candidatus Gracilibacteria bacterium]
MNREYLSIFGYYSLVIYILCSYILLINSIKRFHDINKSGWNSLFLIIPYFDILILIGLLIMPGTIGDNQYGIDSKID